MPMPSATKSDWLPSASIILIHSASLQMGALSSGMVFGRQVQPLLPSRSTVPSLSMMVASALIAEGAADIARAILVSADSPAKAAMGCRASTVAATVDTVIV
jgi:hypothetical protein